MGSFACVVLASWPSPRTCAPVSTPSEALWRQGGFRRSLSRKRTWHRARSAMLAGVETGALRAQRAGTWLLSAHRGRVAGAAKSTSGSNASGLAVFQWYALTMTIFRRHRVMSSNGAGDPSRHFPTSCTTSSRPTGGPTFWVSRPQSARWPLSAFRAKFDLRRFQMRSIRYPSRTFSKRIRLMQIYLPVEGRQLLRLGASSSRSSPPVMRPDCSQPQRIHGLGSSLSMTARILPSLSTWRRIFSIARFLWTGRETVQQFP